MQVSLFNDWRKSVVQSRKIEMLKANGRYTVVGVDREDVFSDKSLGEWEQVLENVNGGEINLDVNELVDQLNPLKWFYDFGHDVVYPYVWKPLKELVS